MRFSLPCHILKNNGIKIKTPFTTVELMEYSFSPYIPILSPLSQIKSETVVGQPITIFVVNWK